MKLALTPSLVLIILGAVYSAGASSVPEDSAGLSVPDSSSNLRGGRRLGRRSCYWNHRYYPAYQWVWDCNAKYDKCQCICDWSGKCSWKNCQDDPHRCGGGGNDWEPGWEGGGGDNEWEPDWEGGGGGGGDNDWEPDWGGGGY